LAYPRRVGDTHLRWVRSQAAMQFPGVAGCWVMKCTERLGARRPHENVEKRRRFIPGVRGQPGPEGSPAAPVMSRLPRPRVK
jgi:hypothetical protein